MQPRPPRRSPPWRAPTAIGSGALLAAAFDPLGFGWSAPIAVAGLLAATEGRGRRARFLTGWLAGASFFLIHLHWLAASIHPAAWLAMSMVLAGWTGLTALMLAPLRTLPAGGLWAGVAWICVEQLRSTYPWGGMPWGQLGFAAIDTPWQPVLALVGVPGVGILTVVVADLVVRAARRDTARCATSGVPRPLTLAPPLALVATTALTAAGVVDPGVGPQETRRVAIVQGGVPGDGRMIAPYHRQVTLDHARITTELATELAGAPPDLVVWPENSTATDPLRDPRLAAAIRAAATAVAAPLLVGSMVEAADETTLRNQAVTWGPDGPTGDSYTKRHPVPFGEYVPLRGPLAAIGVRVDRVGRDALAGPADPAPLDLAGTVVAVAICFDVAYADTIRTQVRRGATFVVVQTSNATFFGTTQPEQQLAITRARAVETGRSIVVASPNGVSGAVGPTGDVLGRLPVGVGTWRAIDVPLSTATTPAMQLAPFTPTLAWLALALAGATLARRTRARPPHLGT